jgi:hypothetical protein
MGLVCLLAAASVSAAFVNERLFVYRIGNGAAPLTANAEPVFIDQYSNAGTQVSSTPMPIAPAAANKPFTATTGALEGDLSLSANGQFLVAGGYGAVPGTAAVASATAATVNRVVARVDSALSVDTSTAFNTGFSTASIWGAVASDGTNFWAVGGSGSTGGVWHVGAGITGGTQLDETNFRDLAIIDAQLLGLRVSSGASQIGMGLPTTAGPTITPIGGFTVGYGGRRWAFVDQRSINAHFALYIVTATGLDKWTSTSYSGGWQLQGSIAAGASAFGVTGTHVVGTGAVIYYSTGSAVMKIVDDGVTPFGMLTPTTFLSAPPNTVFRGVALTPSAPPAVPGAPSIQWAMPTSTTITLAFAPPVSDGGVPIVAYTLTCNPGAITQGAMPDAPNTISGLTTGTPYTCSVTALNLVGPGPASASVTLTPGTLPPTCSLDVDDNGQIRALTDGLVLIRAMFGLTGPAVTDNALGPGAKREDWETIRSFLNAHCGTNFSP